MKRLLTALLAVWLFLTIGSFLALRVFIQPERVEHHLVEEVRQATGWKLAYGEFHLHYFPRISLELKDASFSFEEPGVKPIIVKAQKTKIRMRFFPLLIGRAEFASMEIFGAETKLDLPKETQVQTVSVQNLHFKTGPISRKRPVKVQFDGDLENAPKSISGKAWVSLNAEKNRDWNTAAFEGHFRVQKFPFSQIKLVQAPSGFKWTNGQTSHYVHFAKKFGEAQLRVEIASDVQGLTYALESSKLTSPEITGTAEFLLSWDVPAKEIFMQRGAVTLPAGQFESTGKFFLERQEIQDFRVRAVGLSLDAVPQYFMTLKEAIPFNVGFSGKSDLELSVEGKWDALNLHASWDLTQTLLSSGRLFSKPKDVPLHLNFDFKLDRERVLSGDFSLKLKEAGFKGNFAKLDLKTGTGQVNIISNKFNFAGWETLLPRFNDYALDGEIKILANADGNFLKSPEKIKTVINLTVEDGKMTAKDGTGIRRVNLLLDYGQLSLDIKQAHAEVDGSVIDITGTYFAPYENPTAHFEVASAHIAPDHLFKAITALGKDVLSEEALQNLNAWQQSLKAVFNSAQPLENLNLKADLKNKEWQFPQVQFDLYGGSVLGKGNLNLSQPQAAYQFETEINKISLAKFADAMSLSKSVEGNLFVKAKLEGSGLRSPDWRRGLKGEGEISVTNGEFYTFDILRTVAEISDFSAIRNFVSGSTRFDDFRAPFKLQDEKIQVDNLRLLSRDFSLEGAGSADFSGFLNYRLDVYLKAPVAGSILTGLSSSEDDRSKEIGPIPLLLAGPMAQPEVKPEPAMLAKFQEDMARRKTQKVLRNFLSEEFFRTKKT